MFVEVYPRAHAIDSDIGPLRHDSSTQAPWLDIETNGMELCTTSHHCFDALLAALVARAARSISVNPSLTRREAARREGWIALPLPEASALHRFLAERTTSSRIAISAAASAGSGTRSARRSVERSSSSQLLSHHDVEPSLAVLHDSELLLVLRSFQERLVDDDRKTRDLGLASKPIEPSCPLLEHARVPVEVVVNRVAALVMEIDALAHDGARDKTSGKNGVLNVSMSLRRASREVAPFARRTFGRSASRRSDPSPGKSESSADAEIAPVLIAASAASSSARSSSIRSTRNCPKPSSLARRLRPDASVSSSAVSNALDAVRLREIRCTARGTTVYAGNGARRRPPAPARHRGCRDPRRAPRPSPSPPSSRARPDRRSAGSGAPLPPRSDPSPSRSMRSCRGRLPKQVLLDRVRDVGTQRSPGSDVEAEDDRLLALRARAREPVCAVAAIFGCARTTDPPFGSARSRWVRYHEASGVAHAIPPRRRRRSTPAVAAARAYRDRPRTTTRGLPRSMRVHAHHLHSRPRRRSPARAQREGMEALPARPPRAPDRCPSSRIARPERPPSRLLVRTDMPDHPGSDELFGVAHPLADLR